MFEKYSHTGSWSEALHIFLYVELVVNSKIHNEVEIDQFAKFELKDDYITGYNKWLDEGKVNEEKLIDWIDRYADQKIRFEKEFGTTFKSKVELWSDRSKTSYYKEKLQASFEFENYLTKIFKEKYGLDLGQYLTAEGQYNKGENELGIEIKHDMMYKKTGNLYIEYAEKSKGENFVWIDSGILKSDNCNYFLIGDFDKFWIFTKKRLLEIYKEEVANIKIGKPSVRGIRFVSIATSKGFIYPIKQAEKETLSLDILVNEIKAQN